MKLGKSILLGEFVPAESIDYLDCKCFQIVCPSCYEPLFKVVRQVADNGNLHYLSHYNRTGEELRNCELRVNKITSVEAEAYNSTSREQYLERFLQVLRESVIKNHYKGNVSKLMDHLAKLNRSWFVNVSLFGEMTGKDAKRLHSRSPGIMKEVLGHGKCMLKLLCRSSLEREVHASFELAASSVYDINTEFSERTQKRIARDFWNLLVTDIARSSFAFLFKYTYIQLMDEMRDAASVNPEAAKAYNHLLNVMKPIRKLNQKNYQSFLTEHIIMSRPFHLFDPPNWRAPMATHLMLTLGIRMKMVLLTLPYFQIIKDLQYEKA
jgi:hypothetical protein